MGKKYLFVPDIENERELADKVVHAFMKKSFGTDSVLFFVAKKNEATFNYFGLFPCNLPGRSCNIQVIVEGQFPPEILMQQVDYYIVGNNSDEFIYINLAEKNNVEIIGTIEDEDEIFSDIQIPAEIQNLKNNLYFSCKNVFDKFLPSEYEYFLFHNGLGESLGFFYWLKEYKKNHNKKILLFCWSNSHINLMSVCPYVDTLLTINSLAADFIYIYFSTEYRIKNFFTLHIHSEVLKIQKLFPKYLRKFGVLSNPRDFLGINPEIPFKKYDIDFSSEIISNANKIFNEMGLSRNKTVFFITQGLSQNIPNQNFFIALANNLKNQGYEIITNGNQESIPGCRNLFLPLLETSVFIGLCGNVVSVTTGFNEAICALNTKDKIKLFVLMPGKDDIIFSKNKNNFIMNWQALNAKKYAGRKSAEIYMKDYDYFLSLCMGKNINYSIYQRRGGGGNISQEDYKIIEEITKKILD